MDTLFITNRGGQSLSGRFCELLKDVCFFDVVVGYFYSSGFYALSKALQKTEKIRILIGIGTSKEIVSFIENSKTIRKQQSLFSHAEVQEQFEASTIQEMEESEDSALVEQGVQTFMQWIQSKKIEVRAYPSQNLHAKLYIMTFQEGDRDVGRVITGSSNFTQAGLAENLEFNVELKDRSDYEFAKARFEELWQDAIDVNERYLQTVETKTWLNQTITPYELFLKFLYEYFKDELNQTNDLFMKFLPEGFKRYEYQQQAVLNAKKIVEEYGGVFLSDVVGLGKTYIAAMLASQLDGRTFVIAPPALLDKNNPGSWTNVFSDFHISADFESTGKLDAALEAMGKREYRNIIIDEAHRFRTESTIGYEKLAQLCRGKRVILVTATPYNNSPLDVLNQIKLFQNARKSTIPNLPNLEQFFNKLNENVKKISKKNDYDEYIKVVKDNSKEIREKVLKYLMVRRTRSEIERYFIADVKTQNLHFPAIQEPKPLYYKLNSNEDTVFTET
ncbi:MAG TPA: phospholipase D-like domain-containing protein, partial [Spirochaetales bacterium]|nr:phospholipase D-like domain-containing protein [Spirochaetales bacterium]